MKDNRERAVYMLWFIFIPGLNFIFFGGGVGGMVMYDNEFETKENKI